MATYLGTHGSRIQNYTTDPDNPNTGEVWYNDTSNALKFQIPNVTTSGSWRTGSSANTARFNTVEVDLVFIHQLYGLVELLDHKLH